MALLLVSLAALLASGLTLFSGFGLGTLLMPVVALFVPVELAVTLTAIVHLANNLFKLALLGRHAEPRVLLAFGLPAVFSAAAGAWLLGLLAHARPFFSYPLAGRMVQLHWVEFIVGLLILLFVVLELLPSFQRLSLSGRLLPLGGVISGFFGGLSGHQGAFRSMFLVQLGLSKEGFIATGVVLAVLVDLARLAIYGRDLVQRAAELDMPLLLAASLAAFVGAYAGSRVLGKLTLGLVRRLVAGMLVLLGLTMVSGIL
jgi:uncharacterized membrane protein YfcA